MISTNKLSALNTASAVGNVSVASKVLDTVRLLSSDGLYSASPYGVNISSSVSQSSAIFHHRARTEVLTKSKSVLISCICLFHVQGYL